MTTRQPAAPDPQDWLSRMRAFTTTPERVEQYAETVGLNAPHKRKPAKTGKQSNFARGMEAERWAIKEMRRRGYAPIRRTDSTGASDVEFVRASLKTVGPPIIRVQVKRVAAFHPDALNDAVARFLGKGKWSKPVVCIDGLRTSFLYSDCHGPETLVAEAILHPDDVLVVTGPKGEAVQKSLLAMLWRAENAPKKPKGKKGLLERLGLGAE